MSSETTSAVEPVVDAVVVGEVLTESRAQSLDVKIRKVTSTLEANLKLLAELIAEAKAGQIHTALGFESWPAYVATIDFHWQSVGQRREVVALLSGEGMSQRAIADAVGISKGTVQNDLAAGQNCPADTAPESDTEPRGTTGLDNKTYPRKRNPKPAPSSKQPPIDGKVNRLVREIDRATEKVARFNAQLSVSHREQIVEAADKLINAAKGDG